MNLRQKCKKLKKENERLQKYIPGYPSPIVHVDHYQIVTLAARKELDHKYETLNYYQDLMKNYLFEQISDSLKRSIKHTADWDANNSEYWYKLGYLEAEEDTNKKKRY